MQDHARLVYPVEMQRHLLSLTPEQYMTALKIIHDPHAWGFDQLIRDLPTMQQGWDADLKLEWLTDLPNTVDMNNSSHYRYWVSRMTVEDGETSDCPIILEHRYTKGWRQEWGWRQFKRPGRARAA